MEASLANLQRQISTTFVPSCCMLCDQGVSACVIKWPRSSSAGRKSSWASFQTGQADHQRTTLVSRCRTVTLASVGFMLVLLRVSLRSSEMCWTLSWEGLPVVGSGQVPYVFVLSARRPAQLIATGASWPSVIPSWNFTLLSLVLNLSDVDIVPFKSINASSLAVKSKCSTQ